jgi:phosphoribosylamine--glycine ligase
MSLSRVLVVGSGGREHALAARLLESSSVGSVVVVPGNAGIEGDVHGKPLRRASGDPLEVARREAVDLVVIGPEAPLVAGLADQLRDAGFLVFGPSRRAAQLEGSKAFMKDFAARHRIPTARHAVVRSEAELDASLATFTSAPVVKADGLCAGKGVVVADDFTEARAAAARMLSGEAFGEAGKIVVLEERIAGAEVSVHALCDGERFVLLPAAQDHKRIGDGDRGPNTGGMGTYAPAPILTPELRARVQREIFEPTLRGMASEGNPYLGALFAGLMITPEGEPLLLEFNVRFGDPETQVLMLTTAGDFGAALSAAARGQLDETALRPSGEHAVCVVLAAAGYPEAPRTGEAITGLGEAAAEPGVCVFHAGTARSGDAVVTSGGRVLGVTAKGATLPEAHARAYAAVERVRFAGAQYRRDIARRALGS